jgi:glutathione peroxidase-family protein
MRQWKSEKRKEFRAILKAVNAFQSGCAFTPAYEHFQDLEEALQSMKKKLKNWR